MAHYCKLDENNVVTQVIVVDNKDTADANGVEKESIGVAFCERLFGGTWKQTSYNGNFRKKYAGIGDAYSPDTDVFYNPNPPYPSWTLDANYDWQPPTPKPDDGKEYVWDEPTLAWIEVTSPSE